MLNEQSKDTEKMPNEKSKNVEIEFALIKEQHKDLNKFSDVDEKINITIIIDRHIDWKLDEYNKINNLKLENINKELNLKKMIN